MAEAIHREASGEGSHGKRAVAQVILNRVRHPAYPKTVCDVVFQTGQFSWTKTWNTWTHNVSDYTLAQKIVDSQSAIKGFKATHFHNQGVDPGWKLNHVTTIGNHQFYK
jgi:hypothetical protein